MPAFEAFGRRWYIGSDDFVFPGIVDIIIRMAWLVGCIFVYWTNSSALEGCEDGVNIKLFLHGMLALLHLIIIADIMLVHCSKHGGIMDVEARKYVVVWYYIRWVLAIIELAWVLLGTVWSAQDKLTCSQAIHEERLILGFIICSWILLLTIVFLTYLIFDAFGAYNFELGREDHDPNLAKAWNRRLKSCLCFRWSKNETEQDSLRELSELFATGFEDTNLVLTDMIAGLLLLRFRHEQLEIVRNVIQISISAPLEEEMPLEQSIIEQPVSNAQTQEIAQCSTAHEHGKSNVPWDSVKVMNHYSKYAEACYSCTLVCNESARKRCAIGDCCIGLRCLRLRNVINDPKNIVGDDCCFTSWSAVNELIKPGNGEIVYADFTNEVFSTPFVVVLDHDTKAIVVAIRGTMSLKDVVTDLFGFNEQIPGMEPSFKAHGGMLKTALTIKDKLQSLQLLEKLSKTHPEYSIVITGRSCLGASVASLLSILLVKQYSSLKCYAYSPAGGILSLEAAKFSEPFIVSITYGDDYIGRISTKSLERCKYEIMAVLYESDTPKYRIMMGWLGLFFGIKPTVIFQRNELLQTNRRISQINEEGDDTSQAGISSNDNQENSSESNPEPSHTTLTISTPGVFNAGAIVKKRIAGELLYPPGRIFHITERKNTQPNQNECKWETKWADRSEFRKIIITPKMFLDHLPFKLNKALNSLAGTETST